MEEDTSFIYEIQYIKAADKFFKKHEDIRKLYEDAIKELLVGEHPEKVDLKKIKGRKNEYYRIRLGDWRVIYTLINGKIIVIATFVVVI